MAKQLAKSTEYTSKEKNTDVLTGTKENNNNSRVKCKHIAITQKVLIEKQTLIRLFETSLFPSTKKAQKHTTTPDLTNSVFCGIKLKKQKVRKWVQDTSINFLISESKSQSPIDNSSSTTEHSLNFFNDLITISDSDPECNSALSHETISRRNTQKNTGYKYVTVKYKTILENANEKKWNDLDVVISLTSREKKVSFMDNPVKQFIPLPADPPTSILKPTTIFRDLKDNAMREVVIYRRLNLSDENYLLIELDF